MLLPAQVVPFLAHHDEVLREHAILYFRHPHDPAPLTADDVWAALDQLDGSVATGGLIRLLANLPPSDAATQRLIAAVGDDKYLDAEDDLWDALEDLGIEQLRRHADAILALADLPDDTRDAIRERLELAELPVDELWDRLAQYAHVNREKYWNEYTDLSVAHRLVDALARHGDAAAAHALRVVDSDVVPDDSLDIFAIQLLGRLRHRPALELLARKFVECDEEEDVLHEKLVDAIPRVGGPDAIPLIAGPFPEAVARGSAYPIYASDLLGRIKHPDAEAALLRLLEDPRTRPERHFLLMSIAALCPTGAALAVLRQAVLAGDYEPKMSDLRRDLVACAVMANDPFPELAPLREEIAADDAELERRLAAGELPASFFGQDDYDDDLDYDDYADEDFPDLPPGLDARGDRVVAPIHNAQPKVGRNDPCPCGSGKKYKKCCLNKGEA
jgi:hypothetical protein